MRNHQLSTTGAVLASILALAACGKSGGAAPSGGGAETASNADAGSGPAAAGTPAPAGAAQAPMPAGAQDFVTAAATTDMYEIRAAKLAERKSKAPDVLKFAARMIHDHTQSTDTLKKVLAGGGVSATAPSGLDDKQKGLISSLEAASGADFDKTYMGQQVAVHEEAQGLFQNYIANGDNQGLKDFATAVLPVIQSHLAMAQQIQSAMK